MFGTCSTQGESRVAVFEFVVLSCEGPQLGDATNELVRARRPQRSVTIRSSLRFSDLACALQSALRVHVSGLAYIVDLQLAVSWVTPLCLLHRSTCSLILFEIIGFV